MWDWYRRYYRAIHDSRASATFCERLYGRNLFLYENRHGEAEGVMAAIEAGAHARYLYHVWLAGESH